MSDKSIFSRLEDMGKNAPRIDLEGARRPGGNEERYELIGPLARGAVGVVYRGRDNDLGREVALKVLLEEHTKTPEMVQRFIEEAQIGGQLQHPGIVPVYELGLRADGRPFFAMNLVKGDTLAARLAQRSNVNEDQRALLSAFREVCRTMTYAHVRGVVHRDLKPANVMLGDYGVVKVVDWGFARVMPKGGVADERLAMRASVDLTMISTVGSGGDGSDSVAGSALGTPGYMPPEQAIGHIETLDERSDIFSLGAILCEILTGAPPYTGTADQRRQAAKHAKLEGAHKRLRACKGNEQLVKLCLACLEPLPKDRPRSAQILADEVATTLTSSSGRAHRAQKRALMARGRAEEQRRSRRQTALIATVVLTVFLIGGGVLLWMDADRSARESDRRAAIEAALDKAARLGAAGKWTEALEAAKHAQGLGGDPFAYKDLRAEADAAMDALRVQEDDQAFLAELEEIRSLYRGGRPGEDLSREEEDRAVDAAFSEVFARRFGSVAKSRDRMANSDVSKSFAASIGFWSMLRKDSDELESLGWRALYEVACELDASSAEARAALTTADDDELLAVARAQGDALPLVLVSEVGLRLERMGREEEAVSFLQEWQKRHPNDYWINLRLARALAAVEDRRATRHAFAAVSVRHDTAAPWIRLARQYKEAGEYVDAEKALERALELDPRHEVAKAALSEIEAARAERDAR